MKFWWSRWVNTYSPMFNLYIDQRWTPWWYRIYYSREDAIYDFMVKFYYWSKCKLTKTWVRNYLNWPKWWREWVEDYYKKIIWFSKYYTSLKFKVIEYEITKKNKSRLIKSSRRINK